MIEIRRYLHEHPELSFQEKETSEYIAKFYQDKDVKVDTKVGGYGVKVTIDSGKPGKTLGLRADFDALPIQEDTGLPFTSKNTGVMHACGHDAHTAYLLILAESLIEMKDQLTGCKIVIIHQPAEESPPGGAIAMIKDGVLEGVDNVIGITWWEKIEQEVKRITKGLEEMFNVKCELEYINDYPVLYNDPELTEHIAKVLTNAHIPEVEAVNQIKPVPPSEDFAYFAKEKPSTFFYVGAAVSGETCYPHHHPKFTIDEKSMLIAAKAMAHLVVDYLNLSLKK